MAQERLRELFGYHIDGWLIRRRTGKRIVCTLTKGQRYLRLFVDGKVHRLHRMIYIWHYGIPVNNIDHIDNNRENNRIENLRQATQQENCINRKHHTNSKSPYKNVYWNEAANKWAVSMCVNKVRKYFGIFEDVELADLVASEARDKFQGQFARHY